MELRSLDELEGTLLPVAVPIHASNESGTSAVPVAQFRYEDIPPLQQRDHDQIHSAAAEIEDAPFIPQCDDPRNRAKQVAQALAKANQIGAVKAEIEREALERATRDMQAKNHYNKLLLEEANYVAQRKTWQDDANYDFVNAKKTSNQNGSGPTTQQQPDSSQPMGTGAYQVSEYEVKEYTREGDYQISQYKSVYDP